MFIFKYLLLPKRYRNSIKVSINSIYQSYKKEKNDLAKIFKMEFKTNKRSY